MVEANQMDSELDWGVLYELSPLPIFLFDGLTQACLSANAQAIAHYGYSRDELLGMHVADLHLPESATSLGAAISRLDSQPGVLGSWKQRKRDGTLIDVELVAQRIRRDGREALLVIATDVTALLGQRRVEEEIRRSEERFELAVRGTNDGLWDWNIVDDTQFISPRFLELLGYGEREGGDTRHFITQRIHPDDQARHMRSLYDHLQIRTPYDIELRLETKGGSFRWFRVRGQAVFNPAGRPVRMVGSSTDMAERKLIERALLESEQRFRSLIENAADPILILGRDGAIRYVSPATERVLGYSPAELSGTNTMRLVHLEDRERVSKIFASLLEDREKIAHVEYRLRHKDGTYRSFASVGRNLLDDPGVAGLVINSRDITAQAALEEQLRQAQKMEAVGILAGGVAHDFNNMLTAITSFAEFIASDLPSGSRIESDLGQIRIAADRAVALTRQLLAFSRKQVMQPRFLEVNKVVEGMDKMLRRLIGEDVELHCGLAEALPTVKADPSQLEQVLVNLVVNARDAMPRGGLLSIETGLVVLSEEYARQNVEVRPGRYVLISVADSGVGMDAATQARIFEPFFTTKVQGRGTGLGLSSVYGVVKQNGGHIRVDSQPGRGSTFRVYLPASASQPTLPAIVQREVDDLRGKETILIVEDEELVRGAVRASLERLGYHVLCASDGDQAGMVARGHEGQIDLLLTDAIMPRQTGRAVADQLQSQRPEIAIVFMSGYTEGAIVHHGVLDEGIDFLEKPFTQTALVRKIRQVLDRRRPRA